MASSVRTKWCGVTVQAALLRGAHVVKRLARREMRDVQMRSIVIQLTQQRDVASDDARFGLDRHAP